MNAGGKCSCGRLVQVGFICRCRLDGEGRPKDSNIFGMSEIASYLGVSRQHAYRLISDPRAFFHVHQLPDRPKWATHTMSLDHGKSVADERDGFFVRKQYLKQYRTDPSSGSGR